MRALAEALCSQCNYVEKPKVNCLSLFDGLSAGLFVLLNRLGLDVGNYFSSEIDEDATKVQTFHFFEEITKVGDVRNLSTYHLKKFGAVNLLLAGSPCNDVSRVNPLRKLLYDPDGTGILFFEFIRIRNYLNAAAMEGGYEFFWLFENVTNLDADTLQDMNSFLGCTPIKMIPASSTRERYFWGNVPGMKEKHMDIRVNFVPLQSFLDPGRTAGIDLLGTITTSSSSTKRKGTGCDAVVFQNGEPSELHLTEIEKSLGFPSHFTDVNLPYTRRLKLLGKTWDIDIVQDILEPLCTLFRKKAVLET
ncbi:DNA (cytosine-5)-methyltransferase 3C-like isoform X2 [Thrips palmi]|uniref:DNA (cytosine-5-)-methyltransferase n=1 Tax=Thrips palmi TaxID=161013 RepID=A0A6P8Y5W6_THRPL|nr:DNA (cytosine-5)-methyltransferase 3C-like isoform X2 [Thrips palmi]